MLNLSIFTRSSGFFAGVDPRILVGILAAACVLCAEIAGIAILIGKVVRANKNRKIQEREESGRYSDYGMLFFGVAALPLTAESLLLILTILAAAGAALFLLLLIVFLAVGYRFAPAQKAKEEEVVEREPEKTGWAPAAVTEERIIVPAEEIPEEEPEEIEEAPVEEEPEEDPVREEPVEEEPAEEVTEEPAEEPAEEAVAAFANGEQSATVTPAPAAEAPGTNSGPVRIVRIEKEYTETVKEVHTTTPAASAPTEAPAKENPNQKVEELLSTLIEKIDRNQEAANAAQNSGTATAGSPTSAVPEEDEDDEEDADDEIGASADGEDTEDETDNEPDDPEHFTGNERIIGFDENTGCYIVAHYRKSFEAKLIQSRPEIKHYYSELKNALLAYKGTKSRISWGADSFHNGRTAIAKINVKTRILELYLALEPESLEGTVYRGKDVGHLKKYADTPFRYKLRTDRKFKWAMELVQRVCEEQGLSPIDTEKVDYEGAYPFEETEALVSRGLIKEYIREEKPASTFELDETHVPVVPSVDETVIPANANISWEFDNDRMVEKEPEPEPVEEPAPEPEPIPEPAPAPQQPVQDTTVIRETTKVTQMRYTEQYYGAPDGQQNNYQQYLTNEPFVMEGIFEPADDAETKKTETVTETVTDANGNVETVKTEETVTGSAAEEPAEEHSEENSEENSEELDGNVPEETEPESGLVSAFEKERKEPEDDLDWGIPAELTVSYAVDPEPEEAEIEEPEPAFDVEEPESPGEPEEFDGQEEIYDDAEAEDAPYEEEDPEAYSGEEYPEEYPEGYAEGDPGEDYAEEAYSEEGYAEEGYSEEEYLEEEYGEEGEDGATYYYDESEYAEEDAGNAYADGYSEDYAEEDANGYEEETGEYTDENGYSDDMGYAEEPERPHVNPELALMNVSVLEENFPSGSTIDLDTLKAKGLVMPNAKRLKFYATGSISKKFTVIADQFTIEAIMAINDAGGDSRKVR